MVLAISPGSIGGMRTRTIPSFAAGLAASLVAISASAVDVSCPSSQLWLELPRSLPLNAWDVDANGSPLPALGQGQNGITCEMHNTVTGVSTPLTWLFFSGSSGGYQCWGAPRLAFNVPQIYAMPTGKRIWAHPNVNLEAVIRVTLNGEGGPMRVTGAAGSDASLSITFTIYRNDYAHPIWTGGVGAAINLELNFTPGEQLLFVTNSGSAAEEDWAWWGNVQFYVDKPIELTGDGHVNAADLAVLLGAWGACDGCAADLDCSGAVDASDLSVLLGAWTG